MVRVRAAPLFLFILLITTGVLSAPQQDGGSNGGSDSFSLITVNPLLPTPRLKVYRGKWSPLLRQHLPITKRVLRGGRHICRVEVEELAPIFSIVGHLEPKHGYCLIYSLKLYIFHY
ncbi:hypothetical protein ACTXT7_006806 [Hymenolepis weldensis]